MAKQDEILQNITHISQNVNKVEEDSKDRASLVREELKVVEAALTQSFQDLENKVAVDESTLQHRVQIAFDKTNGKFRDQFEEMVQDHQRQMASADADINQKFLQNNRDIEKYLDEQMIKLKESLATERAKYDTIQQGKNQQYTIEVEGRILNKVSAVLDENSKLKQEIFKKVDQCNNDVEKIYKESQDDKLMWDTKMTTREAAMKEWTMKLLEDNYDDFNRLLNAKSVEIENQTKTLLASMGPKEGGEKSDNLTHMTMKESVNSMGINLKNELLQLFEDDRRLKNIRFTEVYNLLESNKNNQTELINQQFESQKALVKAIINKEVAERTVADEELLTIFNQKLNKMKNDHANTSSDIVQRQQELEGKIDKTYEAINIRVKNSQLQMEAQLDEVHQLIQTTNDQVQLTNQQIIDLQEEMGQPVTSSFKPQNAENTGNAKTANTAERSINKNTDKFISTGMTNRDGQEETKVPASFTQGEAIKVDLGDSMGPVEEQKIEETERNQEDDE